MLLTATESNATLYAPFEKSKGSRIGVLKSHGVSRFNAVFLCAKSQFIYMSDWVEHSKEWLGRVSSTPTLLSSDSMIGVMLSGFKILHTEAIMPKYAQEPTKQNPLTFSVSDKAQSAPQKTSRFNVIDKATKRLIAYKIPFDCAIQCHKQNQTVIKFAEMVGGVA